jgi:ABC-type antimicrobial peptide transport system permease subunit
MELRGEVLEIAGVVADTEGMMVDQRGTHLRDTRDPVVYRLLEAGAPWRGGLLARGLPAQYFLAVRTASNPLEMSKAVRSAIRDAGGVVAEMDTMERFVENATWQNQQAAGVITTFALPALLLAGVGLYGVISYAVGRRTREIGVRVAVGARPLDVIGLVLSESARPVLIGAAIGLAAALALGRLMSSLLYHVTPADPPVLIGVAASIGASALAACLVPIRRALRVDPSVALRTE